MVFLPGEDTPGIRELFTEPENIVTGRWRGERSALADWGGGPIGVSSPPAY